MSFVFEGKSHKWQTVKWQVKVPKCVDKWMRPLKFHPSINIKWKDYLPKRWSPVVLKSHTYVNTLKLAIQASSTHSLLFVVEYCAKVTHKQFITILSALFYLPCGQLAVLPSRWFLSLQSQLCARHWTLNCFYHFLRGAETSCRAGLGGGSLGCPHLQLQLIWNNVVTVRGAGAGCALLRPELRNIVYWGSVASAAAELGAVTATATTATGHPAQCTLWLWSGATKFREI